MFIGNLEAIGAETSIKYYYKKGGTECHVYPTVNCEKTVKDCYDTTGNLFTDYVEFDGTLIIDGTIDVVIMLGKECFVDHISFKQGENSEIANVVVLTENDEKTRPVGVVEAQTGKTIKDTDISIPIGIKTDNIILRIEAVYVNFEIGNLEIWGATGIDNAVYPVPEKIDETDGYLENITGISAGNENEKFAADYFAEKYKDLMNAELTINGGNVAFELVPMSEEQFEIFVTKDSATIKGGSKRALLYAADKLLQLCGENGIKTVKIQDKPFMEMRGVHFALPDREQLPFIKRMIKYVFVPMGYNTVILQLSGAMEYKTHPEFNKAWKEACDKYEAGEWPIPAHYHFVGHDILTQEEVLDLCDYIRSFGLDIIPEVQSLSHAQYITMAYPQMGEVEVKNEEENIDLYVADVKPDEFYIHSMCPNHPDYYKIIFDIMDEVIELIKPEKYLHIGHDEVYTIGKCQRCRDIPDEEIYAKEVTTLYNHLKEKGLRTMMWSDMIQEEMYTTHKAIDLIPKDIVCLSFTWYFHPELDVEDKLYDYGFDVIIGNFYSSYYKRFDKRKHGKNLIGAEVSTWVPCDELSYAFEGKMYDFVYSANMFWNKDFHENLRRTNDYLLDKLIPNIRKYISGRAIDKDAKSIEFKKERLAVPSDIREFYDSCAMICKDEQMEISVSNKANKISFLHATDKNGERVMWERPKKIGSYIIEYIDGSSIEEEIFYGANIMKYKRAYAKPIETHLFRHEGYIGTYLAEPIKGKTCKGEDFTLYDYVCINPNPEKEIKKIRIKNVGKTDASILLFDVKVK